MADEIKFEKTSFDIPAEVLTRFRVECARRNNIPMKRAIAEAIEEWLSRDQVPVPSNVATSVESDIVSDRERAFLNECSRIYRSEFGKPLQENVKFFGIGLSAIEKLAAIEASGDERDSPDAISAGERRAAARADLAENEARLLKKAAHDATEKRGRTGQGDQKTANRTPAGRTGHNRKTGSGGGD